MSFCDHEPAQTGYQECIEQIILKGIFSACHQLIFYKLRQFHQREERGKESRGCKSGYIYSRNRIDIVRIYSQRNK